MTSSHPVGSNLEIFSRAHIHPSFFRVGSLTRFPGDAVMARQKPSEYPGWNVKKRRGRDGRYRLADGTPRAFRNHTTKAAKEYCQYVRDLTLRLGGLPRAADPLLREAGRIVVELNRGHGELEQMRQLPGARQGEERGAIFRLEDIHPRGEDMDSPVGIQHCSARHRKTGIPVLPRLWFLIGVPGYPGGE
jgi:hypothetical protein